MNHFENLYRYSFGYENPTIGIVYATSKEDAITQIKEAYGWNSMSLEVRPFNVEQEGVFNMKTGTRSDSVLILVD